MSTLIAGHWLSSNRSDPRAVALFCRHYSAETRGATLARRLKSGITGAGEDMVLLTEMCDALFVWRLDKWRRLDDQEGLYCSVFRNEGPTLSSELIREADELADGRWPGLRHFTYVWDAKVRSANPGYCFLKAGWQRCGRNKDGRLTILERLPEEG